MDPAPARAIPPGPIDISAGEPSRGDCSAKKRARCARTLPPDAACAPGKQCVRAPLRVKPFAETAQTFFNDRRRPIKHDLLLCANRVSPVCRRDDCFSEFGSVTHGQIDACAHWRHYVGGISYERQSRLRGPCRPSRKTATAGPGGRTFARSADTARRTVEPSRRADA